MLQKNNNKINNKKISTIVFSFWDLFDEMSVLFTVYVKLWIVLLSYCDCYQNNMKIYSYKNWVLKRRQQHP